MRWFKFYGQDFLTDTKIIGMDPLLRQIWVTLLCLADENGQISHLREYDLQKLSGCDDNTADPSDYDRTTGCLEYFKDREMIALQTVTDSNGTVTNTVTLRNYSERQSENLSNAERQKRYRENHKIEAKPLHNSSNVTPRNDSNARREEKRIDKNIKKEIKKENSLSFLEKIPDEELEKLHVSYKATKEQITNKGSELVTYCRAHGKKYTDYRSLLQGALLKDFGRRPVKSNEIALSDMIPDSN